ncbi:tetraspanin-17-like [Anneissia japonica]|uniref:tetraspanin-17-like n=1 Tax=Anneissia japonica TaxID=1529436 RepID=UPI0014259F01|nr:tetraspanin-17-like [Anneissia japonica]
MMLVVAECVIANDAEIFIKAKEDEMIPNTQCGDDVRKGVTNRLQLQGKIYIRGCVDAFSAWAEDNLALIAGIILGFALPQFECCGGHDYDDWENNIYFMCNTGVASSCGVPYTCCVSTKDEMIPNTQCGDDVRKGVTNRLQLQGKIYIRGCVDAFSAWAEDNLALIAGIILGFALPQVCSTQSHFG